MQFSILRGVIQPCKVAEQGIEVFVMLEIMQEVGLEQRRPECLLDLILDKVGGRSFGIPVALDDVG